MGNSQRIGSFFRLNRWLLISLVMLGLAAYFSLSYVKHVMLNRPSAAPPKTVSVVVARAPIGAYEPIQASDLSIESLPAGTVPAGSFASSAALAGHWSNEAIAAGIPIVSGAVFEPKTTNLLAARIHHGDMGVDLPLTAPNAVDGAIRPGDTISLFTTITEKDGQQVTEDFLNDIKVLAVNGSLTPAKTSTIGQSTTLILALPPRQIATLLFVEQKGSVSAALDGPNAKTVPPAPYGTSNWQTPVR